MNSNLFENNEENLHLNTREAELGLNADGIPQVLTLAPRLLDCRVN